MQLARIDCRIAYLGVCNRVVGNLGGQYRPRSNLRRFDRIAIQFSRMDCASLHLRVAHSVIGNLRLCHRVGSNLYFRYRARPDFSWQSPNPCQALMMLPQGR